MIKKCSGCGVLLQEVNSEEEGYTKNINNDLCERCFRIKHYNDYKIIIKDNSDFMPILNQINLTNDLVLLVVDLFNIPSDLSVINKYLKNDQILILTKRDLFMDDIYDKKFLDHVGGNYRDKIVISSNNNFQFDELFALIEKHQTSKNVYVVGFTNAGKSTMINKLLYNYSDSDYEITTSILPSTTLNTIEVSLNNNVTLIDTPGIIDAGNIMNIVEGDVLKRITPKKPVKPITFQIKTKQYITVSNLLIVESDYDNSYTFYFAPALDIDRKYSKPLITKLVGHELVVAPNSDVVVSGLGFIKIVKETKIKLYTLDGVNVYVRKALI